MKPYSHVCSIVLGSRRPKTEQEKERCFKILSDIIKENRWELFGTLDGYQIINNGFGHFKEIRFKNQLSSNRPMCSNVVISKLKEIYKK